MLQVRRLLSPKWPVPQRDEATATKSHVSIAASPFCVSGFDRSISNGFEFVTGLYRMCTMRLWWMMVVYLFFIDSSSKSLLQIGLFRTTKTATALCSEIVGSFPMVDGTVIPLGRMRTMSPVWSSHQVDIRAAFSVEGCAIRCRRGRSVGSVESAGAVMDGGWRQNLNCPFRSACFFW